MAAHIYKDIHLATFIESSFIHHWPISACTIILLLILPQQEKVPYGCCSG